MKQALGVGLVAELACKPRIVPVVVEALLDGTPTRTAGRHGAGVGWQVRA
jgi:hypothetical protein